MPSHIFSYSQKLGFVGIRNREAGVDALFAVGEVVDLLDYVA